MEMIDYVGFLRIMVLKGIFGFLILLFLFTAKPAFAYESVPDESFLLKYQKQAEQGNVDAQASVASYFYAHHNFKEAEKWYLKAAKQGSISGQLGLGQIFERREKYKEAEKWYLKAAKQGSVSGQLGLGHFFERRKKYLDAASWWHKAAAQHVQGSTAAYEPLGRLYASGHGVKQSWEEAYFWYSLDLEDHKKDLQTSTAFKHLNPVARETLLNPGINRRGGAVSHLTPEQRVAVDKRVQEWMLKPYSTSPKPQ